MSNRKCFTYDIRQDAVLLRNPHTHETRILQGEDCREIEQLDEWLGRALVNPRISCDFIDTHIDAVLSAYFEVSRA